MLNLVLALTAICGMVESSGVHQAAPVVTASSSQYFERTFNRLVAPPVFLAPSGRPQHFVPVQQPVAVQPVTHLQPVQKLQPVPSFQSVIPVQPVQPLQPTHPSQPAQPQPVEPNVAIAIATANAAAPVATILLPPYPFGFPPTFGLIPQEQPSDDRTKEETTTKNPTTQADVKTTKEPEATTQVPDGSDNNVVQALPSNQDESQVNFRQYLGPSPLPTNQNVNFKQYAAPSPLPSNQDVNLRQYLGPNPQYQRPHHQLPLALPHHHHHHHPHTNIHVHPKKLKTLVEVQRVPLAYIAPPPLLHFEHNHQAIKVVKQIHSFLPSKAKLIIRPVLKTRSIPPNTAYNVRVSSSGYKVPVPLPLRNIAPRTQNARPFNTKEMEPTTFRPFLIPNTKPPRL